MKRRALKGPIERLASLAAIASLGAQGASPSFAQSPVRPPFIPVNTLHLELPPGMQPLWPIFAQGGRDILFQNGQDRNVWVIGKDGSALHCVTCSLPADLKKFGLGFVHDFPDGKRLLLADGVAASKDLPKANAWVLECGTSLRDCTTPRVLPIDMSADRGPASLFQRRTFHMSPDGSKIGWMEVRSDGTVMVVARLERAGDRYVAADPRVVNPIGPRSDRDDDADRWENLSQLYELKSFTPDGKAILAVGTLGLNIDVLRIELASGQVTRLTANPDWDEDSSLSPDQKSFVVHSWRSQHRLDAIAWIPQLRGFTGLMMGAAIAPFYVSTWEGFQCDLAPWLLSARGEVNERIGGLNAGADDYLPKPFVIAELVARVRALGRRSSDSKSTELRVGGLTLDTVARRAQRAGKTVELTAREFRLLEFLMRSAGRICGRMSIIEKVWDYDFDPGTNLVDVYIRRLREKIDDDFEPKLLHTVRGIGYVLKESP